MKSKFMILSLCIMSPFGMKAQVMEWVIKPTYKDIVPMGGELYKVKDSNGKWGVYNAVTGEQTIEAKYDSITPLVENRALILGADGQDLYGIINDKGIPVQTLVPSTGKPEYIIHREFPYYSEGLLAVGQIQRNGVAKFGYVGKQGEQIIPCKSFYASPFDHGLAMIWNGGKSYQIIDNGGNSQIQSNEDIKFISNPLSGVFVYATGNGNKVRKAKLEGHKIKVISELNKGGHIVETSDATTRHSISCRGGDTFRFDRAFHYIENGAEPSYTINIQENSSRLTKARVGRQYGLNYDSRQILKEQFKNICIYNDEYALVTLQNGAKGLLQYNPSGKISVSGPDSAIEFAHNTNQMIPVTVSCSGMYNNPVVELTYNGTTERCNGNGQVQFPFYEGHDKSYNSTTKPITVEMKVDDLNYGSRTFEVKSSHSIGYKLGNVTIPAYSNMNGSATTTVTIYAVNGTPSSTAKATVNGITKSFNGQGSLTFTIPVSVPQGGSKSVSINIRVTEDECPTWTAHKTGTVQHLSRK